ncbi:hypothetical protein TNIN_34461 [Trichonephila inaurata madagascariensis]|uniref:C2H2-type domain-containing protein n=1 Tax=Trichonephila inaurata madagascariensis TaxID=2747483 RepID=A0A8X7BRQ4_9ARAC|nr:hypothetical protein TNIN_34461 [Trichonephila inaurata madagascariensis]
MAEQIPNFSEEFFYFCQVCACEFNEPGRLFIQVYLRQSYFHCTGCTRMCNEGVKTRKINLTCTSIHLCAECGNRYRRMSDLLHHTCEHYGPCPFLCAFCHTGFAVYSVLEAHLRLRNYILELICKNCSVAFRGKICPNVHKQLLTTGEFYCENCNDGSRNIEYVAF